MADVKYPEIPVKLTGRDGNAFAILGSVINALKRAQVPKTEIDEFAEQAMAGDYDALLRPCMQWMQVH